MSNPNIACKLLPNLLWPLALLGGVNCKLPWLPAKKVNIQACIQPCMYIVSTLYFSVRQFPITREMPSHILCTFFFLHCKTIRFYRRVWSWLFICRVFCNHDYYATSKFRIQCKLICGYTIRIFITYFTNLHVFRPILLNKCRAFKYLLSKWP